jgi:outer membrane protein TolC
MKKIIWIVLAIIPALIPFQGIAQDSLNLGDCHRLALESAPRGRDRGAITSTGILKDELSRSQWYPSLDLNGKLSYQSDVVTIALSDPSIPVSFPEVPLDQYGLNIDLKQTIYDGGRIRQRRSYEETLTAAELQQVEVDLQALKPRINHTYFQILVLQENLRNLELHLSGLQTRKSALQSAIEQGAVLESEAMVLEVEILRIRQSMVEAEAGQRAQLDFLGVLCDTVFPSEQVFTLPEMDLPDAPEIRRPEYLLFDLQQASMEESASLLGKERMPVLYAFGQTGYGKPGYNMLSGEWDFYYMIGAGISWNIWDWNSSRRKRQVVENQQTVLRHRRDHFDRELEAQLAKEQSRIDQFREIRTLEQQVLALREEITVQAATRLENGTITASDYINELNKETLARIQLSTHEIRLQESVCNYLTIQGKL